MLCKHCTRLFERPLYNWEIKPQVRGRCTVQGESDPRLGRDVLESAASGCGVCSMYWEYLGDEKRQGMDERHAPGFWLGWDKDSSSFYSFELGPRRTDVRTQFRLLPAEAVDHMRRDQLLPRNTAADDCWEIITKWLRQCVTSHRSCNSHLGKEHWLPTRLIDVQHGIHLVISQEANVKPEEADYITLSHRWSSNTPRLMRDNLITWRTELPEKDLPQTFCDAANVTRRLGYRYLWIDSLCIIQDCPVDWNRESSMMGKVYQKGICNIAATAASDGADGLFVEREPLPISSFSTNIDWKGHKKSYIFARSNLWDRGLIKSVLNRRAWVVQERLLSSRTIHFGPQIFWECRELEACETWPAGLPAGLSLQAENEYHNSATLLAPKSWPMQIRTPSGPSEGPYRIWKHIVRSYMECGLTKREDKLVALSGVAKEIGVLLNDEYIAGLWRKDLLNELTWTVFHGSVLDVLRSYRPAKYRAPTWSWASVEGRVVFPWLLQAGPALCAVLEAKVDAKSNDITGQLCGGYLKISAMVIKLPFRSRQRKNISVTDETGICPDVWYDVGGNLYALPLMVIDSDYGTHRVLLSLVIRPARLVPDKFERVGLLTLRVKGTETNGGQRQGKGQREREEYDEIKENQGGVGMEENEETEGDEETEDSDWEYEIAGLKWSNGTWILPNGQHYNMRRVVTLL
ncbi:hypothetical protein FGG08_005511 [Glutinoglossum americanum]|uniref:Heterokaryon incompatibility domain-containing protein n=1 Tax=Glutinoglossum americanum TaxID=1670608 RepID=A0A9P8I358_9PEZI|nr:hypothetical protein FGG08_005511 [Glutinoglossum americanum]